MKISNDPGGYKFLVRPIWGGLGFGSEYLLTRANGVGLLVQSRFVELRRVERGEGGAVIAVCCLRGVRGAPRHHDKRMGKMGDESRSR